MVTLYRYVDEYESMYIFSCKKRILKDKSSCVTIILFCAHVLNNRKKQYKYQTYQYTVYAFVLHHRYINANIVL